jgi:processive 1,2-diacylglycerol beta-glucosyltransferase
MKKKVLIISSDYTGNGHKSITDSLTEQFSMYEDAEVRTIDGFALFGNIGLKVGKLYGPVTRNAKDLWKMIWDVSMKKPSLLCEITELAIKDSFLKLLRDMKPDIIVSVHAAFNGSVLNILEQNNIKIPFVVVIADLISISPLWADPRADYTICPSRESMSKCIEFGVPESRLVVTGFPVRSKFFEHLETEPENQGFNGDRPLECLIMSGGEGSGNMARIAKILLGNFDCRVSIITGRNTALKKRLENSLMEKYEERVRIFGFIKNIQDLMRSSDIAFTRGSPNVMMEAVACNTPLIITGALPGQEEENPLFAEKYNLAVVCYDLKELKSTIARLLSHNARELNNIRKAQENFRDPNAAKSIVDLVMKIEVNSEVNIPEEVHRFISLSKTKEGFNKTRKRLRKTKDLILKKKIKRKKPD